MDSRDLAIFVWAVVAVISLSLILKDAILGLESEDEDNI